MGSPTYQAAIVVGASSGIGAAVARRLAASGCRVAIVARREDALREEAEASPDLLRPYAHDVTRGDEVPALFARIVDELGGLDLVVYAAGIMPDPGPDEYDFAKDRAILETNLVGAVAWLNQAAHYFSVAGRGTIVGIGSVAGDRGRAGRPAYAASKAGLATFLEALRNRLAKQGVRVVTIKPGPVQTKMTAHLGFRSAMTAEEAARRILAASGRTGEHYLRLSHRVAFYAIRRIPSPIFRRLGL